MQSAPHRRRPQVHQRWWAHTLAHDKQVPLGSKESVDRIMGHRSILDSDGSGRYRVVSRNDVFSTARSSKSTAVVRNLTRQDTEPTNRYRPALSHLANCACERKSSADREETTTKAPDDAIGCDVASQNRCPRERSSRQTKKERVATQSNECFHLG